MPYVTVDVDVDLDEFDDNDLLDEIKQRNLSIYNDSVYFDQMTEIITAIWQKRREGEEYQKEIDDLIYYGIGKIV
jgi:hypothetical protein